MSVGNEGTRAYGGPVSRRGMRSMLFVQTGDARPKSIREGGGPCLINGKPFVGLAQQQAMNSSDRWWLVECDNAEHGRSIIESEGRLMRCRECGRVGEGDGQMFEFCAEKEIEEYGRIIASGGKP